MPSGRQDAEKNFRAFEDWLRSKTDAEFVQIIGRGVLLRAEVAKQCGFSASVLHQNPRVKDSLRKLEDALRLRNVLPPVDDAASCESRLDSPMSYTNPTADFDCNELVQLRAEVERLSTENVSLKRQLEKKNWITDALFLTGRVPR